MDSATKQRVETKVREILRTADMDTLTELKVRELAAQGLGLDLSDIDSKELVREVVEMYLLSTSDHIGGAHGDGRENTNENVAGEGKSNAEVPATTNGEHGVQFLCKLSNKKSVAFKDSAGEKVVLMGEFLWKDGKRVPGSRGIGLPAEQWLTFRKNFPAIEEAIRKVKSHMRCELERKQTEPADKPDPHPTIAELGDEPEFKKQKPNNTTPEEDAQKQIQQKPLATSTPTALNPIVLVRFDGKNYHDWARKMKPFLEQLKLAYVLFDPCLTAAQKWKDDDFMCRTHILSSLSDHLFSLYSKKEGTSKELWDELKLVYLTEEHGSKVSMVKKYMEFEMVEGKSVVEQTQDLHKLADSLPPHGMHVQECFHVNAIISKLPASWKDVGVKLMRENNLSVQMLMNSLKQEEELRKRGKRGVFPAIAIDREKKIWFCSICKKKGHSEDKCWSKKTKYERGKSSERDQK